MLRFRWQLANGRRHATTDPFPRPGVLFTTLCGEHVTLRPENFVELDGAWLEPACQECDREWRQHVGLPATPSSEECKT